MRILSIVAVHLALALSAAAGDLVWEPHVGRCQDGGPLRGERTTLRVPARHAAADGPTLELALVRYRSTNPNAGPPIFFLAGGPGGSGVELAGVVATHPQVRLLEHADVIGIDQRGTGRSIPNLVGPPQVPVAMPLDQAATRAEYVAAYRAAAEQTAELWRDRGVDLAAFNTRESADDLDLIRKALGAERVVLYGRSYGTHLGLAYMRRHGRHVARAILARVEGPDDTWKQPVATQRVLAAVSRQATESVRYRGCDLPAELSALLRDLGDEGIVGVTSAGTRVTLGPVDLQREVARLLATTDDATRLPAVLAALKTGDWSSVADATVAERRGSIAALPLLVDCASGSTAERLRRIEQQRDNEANLLADALNAPLYPEVCEECALPDLGDAFRDNPICAAPTLLISGDLDPRTPPENAEGVRNGLPNAAHVLIRNAGHDARELMSAEFRDLLQAFLRGEAVEDCTITLPPLQFDR